MNKWVWIPACTFSCALSVGLQRAYSLDVFQAAITGICCGVFFGLVAIFVEEELL